MSTKSRAKLKWTEQINWDLLECKKRAKELVGSDTPPCNENGTKKGYIEVMKQLREEKGYEELGARIYRTKRLGLRKWNTVPWGRVKRMEFWVVSANEMT